MYVLVPFSVFHHFSIPYLAYHSYRKLGDVITSIVTLGYHEKLAVMTEAPKFLVDIRRTALARTYSADKNWSIFLGRPPRLGKRFCHLSAVLNRAAVAGIEPASPLSHHGDLLRWDPDPDMSIWAETRWTAACASLKEEILDLFIEERKDNLEEIVRFVFMRWPEGSSWLDADCKMKSDIWQRVDKQWAALPDSFRMEGSLSRYRRGAWEWDFLASTRLGYLHVLFLLRLLRLGSPANPDASFVSISKEILSLVVEVIVLRHQLVCSTGTSFEWRVRLSTENVRLECYY